MLLLHATNTDKQTTNDTLRTFTLSFNCLQEHLLTPHVLHLRRSFRVCRFTQAALLQLKLTSAARPRAVLCATATTKMSVLRGSGLTSTKFRPLATTAISLLKVGQWHSRTWQLHSVFLVVGNSRTLVGTPQVKHLISSALGGCTLLSQLC